MQKLSVSFAGVDLAAALALKGGEVIVRGVGGRNIIAPEASLSRSVGRDGSRFIEASLPSREITLDYVVAGNHTLVTQRDLDQALAGLVVSREPKRLEFSDQPGRWYEAIATSAAVRQGGETWYGGLVTFTCPRPFLFGALVQAEISEQYAAQTNYFVEPVWTVQVSGSAPNGFTLTVNGKAFTYSGPLTSSTRVVIDSAARETRIGGALRVAEASGAYPVLDAANAVALSVPGIVSVEYQARWV